MAGSKIKKKVIVKEKKRKKWVQLMAPAEFGNVSLGEMYLEETSQGKGRIVTMNMLAITGDSKKQNTVLRVIVDKLEGNILGSTAIGYEMGPAHIKRMARKSRTKIDDSFLCESKDGKKIRVKTIIIAKSNVPKSIRTNIRLTTRKSIALKAKGIEFSQFLQQLLRNDIQRQMKTELKKIAAVQNFTVRMIALE